MAHNTATLPHITKQLEMFTIFYNNVKKCCRFQTQFNTAYVDISKVTFCGKKYKNYHQFISPEYQHLYFKGGKSNAYV
jgi:hypothetical protein